MSSDIFQSMYLCILDRFSSEALSIQGFRLSKCLYAANSGLAMLDEWGEQVPHGWVTGDDELGCHTQFRHALRERGERYVLGVPCHTTMRDLEAPLPAYVGRGRPPKGPWPSR